MQPGRCYGFFGRNGAGKTTTIKCLLNLLQPGSGSVRVFGLDPQRHEVAVKSRLSYVPDAVAFYPWMTVSETLEFLASFRPHWNRDMEADLLKRFQLDPDQEDQPPLQRTKNATGADRRGLSRTGIAGAGRTDSGLDPIVRREFIQTVIGAYHASDPENRTVFVSTHLISEFEGLIDEFTIIEQGRELLTMPADDARERFQKIRASFRARLPGSTCPAR